MHTRSGRTIKVPQCFIKAEIGACSAHEKRPIEALNALGRFGQDKISCVGAGIGGRFSDTNELCIPNDKEAMTTPNKPKLNKAIDEEHNCMLNMYHIIRVEI